MRVEIYSGSDNQWHWRLRAANGKITADGSEGYATESSCKRAVRRLFNVLINGPLRIVTTPR